MGRHARRPGLLLVRYGLSPLLVLLCLVLSEAAVLRPGGPASPAYAAPLITSVVFQGSSSSPVVVVNGSGFGATAPSPSGYQPNTAGGCQSFFDGANYGYQQYGLDDTVATPGRIKWSAGQQDSAGDQFANCIGIKFTPAPGNYTDTQVTFFFGSAYGTTGWTLQPGDPFKVYVAGVSCAGTVNYTAAVSCTSAPAPPTPTLTLAETHPGNNTTIFGQISGAVPSTTYTLSIYSASSCSAQPGTLVGTASVATDGSGAASFSPTVLGSSNTAGTQIAATVTGPSGPASALSSCIAVAQGNDTWDTATQLWPDTAAGAQSVTVPQSATVPHSIYKLGQERWYDFPVQPGAQVHISFNGQAGSVLTLHTDIRQLYNGLSDPSSASKLAADLAIQDAPSGYLPSGYLPSGYLPSGYLPSGYLPSGYLPSGYLPSGYLPSGYLPSGYLPSGYLPSGYLPSGYLPSGYLPSGYLPSGYLPSGYLPSGYLPGSYASVPRQSLMAIATSPTATALSIDRNTWDLTGHLYVRVAGPLGAFTLTVSEDGGVCGSIAPVSGTNVSLPTTTVNGAPPQTLILWDSTRWDSSRAGDSSADVSTLQSKVATFAGRADVNGQVIDLHQFARVVNADSLADSNAACPAAKNLVANEIKSIVQGYRNAYQANGATTVKYIVLVGDDHSIPFFRYPDESGLAPENGYVPPVSDSSPTQASLRNNYVLGQDEYGSSTSIPRGDHSLPIPDVAVGRLVDTAAEASHMLDAYTASNGVITPGSALVTGYDFVADAATSALAELSAGINPAGCSATSTCVSPDRLIAPQGVAPTDPSVWTADNLRQKLYGSRHDIVFLAGHFSAGNLLASDYATQLSAAEVAGSTANLTDTLVLALGCHGGLNIPGQDAVPSVSPSPDWPEAMAEKGATLLAATGYAYGDTVLTEYGERLFVDVARQLRTGTGNVSIGAANVAAKQDYLNTHLDLGGIDEKTLLEATLYGLPMLQVNMQGPRLPATTSASIVSTTAPETTGPGAGLGLALGQAAGSSDIDVAPTTTMNTTQLTDANGNNPVTASWLSGASGVVAHPLDPVFPLQLYNATVPNQVLRGIGFRGGTYKDLTNLAPLTVAPSTETSVGHPTFFSDVFYPTQVWSANYFDTIDGLNGGTTSLAVAPAQYQSSAPGSTSGTFRQFTDLKFRLYYLSNSALANQISSGAALDSAPNIVGAASTRDSGGTVTFQVRVQNGLLPNGDRDLQDVWVTYNDPGSSAPQQWLSLDLTQCEPSCPSGPPGGDPSLWTATAPGLSSATVYMVQAANATGLISLNTNNGAYFSIAPDTASTPYTPTLTLQSPLTIGDYQTSAQFTVNLQSIGPGATSPIGLANQTVAVHLGDQAAVATTGSNGQATITLPLGQSPGPYNLWASYEGATIGSAAYNPVSSAISPFTINQAPTTLTLTPSAAMVTYSSTESTAIAATLQANGVGLAQKSVYFSIVAGSGGITHKVAITDARGNAALGPLALPPGTYSVRAAFASSITDPAVQYTDPYYNGSSAPAPASLTINTPPLVTGITVPSAPYAVNTSVLIGTTFTDADVELGAYTATVMYQTVPGSITPASGSCQAPSLSAPGSGGAAGTVTSTCTFPTDGIYYVTVTLTDPAGASSAPAASNLSSSNPTVGSSATGDIVVYDPSAGFVTGGGWITSPQNLHLQYMQASGKATFGFVSKYVKGSTVPAGNTDFQFEAGGLHFQSSSYTWMVVGGGQAQYQGTGKVNGAAGYTFRLTADDAQATGNTSGSDTFRMQIWDSGSNLVYDNGSQSPLGGGDIVIHSS